MTWIWSGVSSTWVSLCRGTPETRRMGCTMQKSHRSCRKQKTHRSSALGQLSTGVAVWSLARPGTCRTSRKLLRPQALGGVWPQVECCKVCIWHCVQANKSKWSNGWATAEEEPRNPPWHEQTLYAAFPRPALRSPGHSAEAWLSRASLYLGYPGPSLPCWTGDWLFQ